MIDAAPSSTLTCTSATNSRVDSCLPGRFREIGTPGNADTCVQDTVEAREAALSEVATIADTLDVETATADTVSALLSSVMESTRSNLTSADAADAGLRSLEVLTTATLTDDSAAVAGEAVSNLLRASGRVYDEERKRIRSGTAASTESAEVAEANAARRATAIANVLQSVTLALAENRPADSTHVELATEEFTLGAHSPPAEGFSGKSLPSGNMSVTFPHLPAFESSGEIQTIQTVAWEGLGPHFWAGPELPGAPVDVNLGSSVLTVAFFDGNNAKVNVSNLSSPVLLGLAAAAEIFPNSSQVMRCAYWDEGTRAWVAEVDGKALSATEVVCGATHFTDWAAFIGPPPQMNELGSLKDITNNPTGMVVSLTMLAISLLACAYGSVDYRRFARMAAAPADDDLRKKYEQETGAFALHTARLRDSDLPWSTRAIVQLRRRWLGGSIFCPLPGDPWLRSQRLFTVLVQVLLSMSMAALFFQAEDQLPGGTCSQRQICANSDGPPGHPCCAKPNGLLASLLTAGCALPLIAAVNIAFGWLRRPLEADATSKSGEQLARLQEAERDEQEHPRGGPATKTLQTRRRDRCLRKLRRWSEDCSKCMRVQCRCARQCLCKRRTGGVGVHDQHSDDSGSDESSSGDSSSDSDADEKVTKRSDTKAGETPTRVAEAPRQSAPVCQRRKQVARQMRTCAETIDSMFDRLDRDHSGTLSIDELRELMREVSQGAPLGEDDVSFVMQHAQRGSDDTGTIARTEIQHAISLWRYLLHERKFIVDRFDEFDHDKNGRLDRGELKALMTSLNDGIECTDKEVTWVIKLGTSAYAGGGTGKASLDADEVRGALAMWYPALRKRRQLEELPIALRGATGKTRRAVSAQLSRYRVEVDTLMQQEGCVDGTMGRSTLHRLLNQLNGAPVSDAAVDYVLALSDADHSDIIEPREVATAVATWCTLRQQQDLIDASFDEFDVDHSGKLSREQVRRMLQQLNDGLPVTWTEVDWTIESADANGDGSLDRQELRAAVACWYLHVSSRVIVPLSGWRAMVPWVLCSCVGLVCAMLVASISVKWSVVDTKAWLGTTLLSLVWKLVVFDPIKTLCCGSLLDPFYALICGEFEADALLESVEDVVETYTEEFTGAQVGGQAVDDVSRATQAATIAAGNNAIFAMGGLGAGKFHRKVALNRGKRGFKIEMQQHDQDAAAVDRRLGLQHTLSHSRYAEKINAKRQAAGFSTAEFSNRSMRSVISAHQTQMEQVDESEHTQLAALMVASAKREQLSVDESVAAQATAARRRYAGRVANKRRARGLTIGGFARSSGVQVDPLVDIMAVSKFVDARTKPASPSSSTQKETAKDLEAQSAEATEFAFGEMASGRLDLSASMITRQRPREVAAEVAVSPATDYDPAAAAGKEYDWLDGVALSGGVSDEEIETVELVPPDSAGARGGQQGQEGRSRRAGKRRN